MKPMKTQWWMVMTAAALAVAGCEDGHDHEHESPEEEACEHLKDGPAAALTASTTDDGADADVSKSHTRFDITLPGDGDKKGGYAKFISAKAGDYLLVLNADVPVQLLDLQGNAVTPKTEATAQTGCSAVKRRAVYTLGVATYRLKLGPTAAASVGVLFEGL